MEVLFLVLVLIKRSWSWQQSLIYISHCGCIQAGATFSNLFMDIYEFRSMATVA